MDEGRESEKKQDSPVANESDTTENMNETKNEEIMNGMRTKIRKRGERNRETESA